MTRIFQSISLNEHSLIELDEIAHHHLVHVLRVEIGDEISVFNGEGGEYLAVVQSITKKNIVVHLKNFISKNTESTLDLWLAQGISRGEKMDYTIQKAVELGVKKIIPLFTERCNVKLSEEKKQKRWQHWRSIIIHACEQSGRTHIPELLLPISLQEWLNKKNNLGQGFVLAPDASTKLKQVNSLLSSRIILLVGPEGGLSKIEIDNACGSGFQPLSLGPRILRTETAGVAALAALQCLFGDIA